MKSLSILFLLTFLIIATSSRTIHLQEQPMGSKWHIKSISTNQRNYCCVFEDLEIDRVQPAELFSHRLKANFTKLQGRDTPRKCLPYFEKFNDEAMGIDLTDNGFNGTAKFSYRAYDPILMKFEVIGATSLIVSYEDENEEREPKVLPCRFEMTKVRGLIDKEEESGEWKKYLVYLPPGILVFAVGFLFGGLFVVVVKRNKKVKEGVFEGKIEEFQGPYGQL